MSDWKYDLDEVGEDADSEQDTPDPEQGTFESKQDALDSEQDAPNRGPDDRDRGPLEPGSPTAENAFFVTLGVATMLFLFARVILVVGG